MFPLRSHAPINFEFQLTFVEPHSAFTVDPMAGLAVSCVIINKLLQSLVSHRQPALLQCDAAACYHVIGY